MTTPQTSRRFSRIMNLRIVSRLSGKKLFDGESVERVGLSTDSVGYDKELIGADASSTGDSFEVTSDAAPYADNDDFEKIRFRKMGVTKIKRAWRKFIALTAVFVSYVKLFGSPKLSADEKLIMAGRFRRWNDEELDLHRREKENARIFTLHKQQAQLVKQRLVEVLTNLRFCYSVTRNERVYIKKKIKITQVDVSPYAYTFHITRVPYGVKLTDMAQDWVSTELAASIGKKMRYDLDLEGLRYTVEVGSTLSIPNFVGFGDLDDKQPMPKNLPPLAFWAGLAANGSPIYRNLADAPHLIIAGSSGGGKSNMENTIACTYIRNNGPERVRMVFFDLKGGVEFSQYEGLRHLWPMENKKNNWECNGIVEYPEDTIPALKVLFDECMTRLAKLKKAKVKNINEYNRHKKNRMPFIVVFFDEWASTKKLVGAEAETILSNIANLSRAAGIHFILSTQYPKAEIINTTISVNFPWRIAFAMQPGASQSVLGDWGAVGLNPKGRAVLLTSSDGQMQIQTPRITNENVIQVVETSRTGASMGDMKNIDAGDILEWAINNTGGKLDTDTLFNHFKGQVSKHVLSAMLKDMDNNLYDVQGMMYRVVNGIGNLPRHMELAEESGLDAEVAGHGTRDTAEPVTRDEEKVTPYTCVNCGAQALINPCEYCGKYVEEEHAS